MPIYEYFCPDCRTKFELMRPISMSSKLADCPICKHKAKRALSRFVCHSSSEFGTTAPIAGGGACAGCAGGNCSSCNT